MFFVYCHYDLLQHFSFVVFEYINIYYCIYTYIYVNISNACHWNLQLHTVTRIESSRGYVSCNTIVVSSNFSYRHVVDDLRPLSLLQCVYGHCSSTNLFLNLFVTFDLCSLLCHRGPVTCFITSGRWPLSPASVGWKRPSDLNRSNQSGDLHGRGGRRRKHGSRDVWKGAGGRSSSCFYCQF